MNGKLESVVSIPEGIEAKLKDSVLTVKGNLGKLERDFKHTRMHLSLKDNELSITTYFPKKAQKATLGTVVAHVNNMIKGVTSGFKYSLKIVYSHFPIKVSEDRKTHSVKIENLYGGQKARFAKIVGAVKIQVDGENVFISGIDKEAVGQTAANIQELTRLRGKRRKSPKTFMDGIFVFDKHGKMA